MRLSAAVALVLAGCQGASEPTAAGSPATAAAVAVPTTSPAPITSTAPFAVNSDRAKAPRIAGCPGMNPARRPQGSNCHGLFPEQCGADRAAAFKGRPLDDTTRAQIDAIAPPGGIRYIAPGEPVTEDLRAGRLNVELGGSDSRIIAKVDCY